jgi:hypothetical protein
MNPCTTNHHSTIFSIINKNFEIGAQFSLFSICQDHQSWQHINKAALRERGSCATLLGVIIRRYNPMTSKLDSEEAVIALVTLLFVLLQEVSKGKYPY